jgi:hypothetical protein
MLMKNGMQKLELEFPKDVLEHAKESGISIEDFKKSLELFGTMQLVSETSGLSRKQMERLSKDIKVKAWAKTLTNAANHARPFKHTLLRIRA